MSMTATEQPARIIIPLILADRCDSDCGAQAFVRATMPSGSEILFCKHHYEKHEVALGLQGAHIQDERESINKKPSISANAI